MSSHQSISAAEPLEKNSLGHQLLLLLDYSQDNAQLFSDELQKELADWQNRFPQFIIKGKSVTAPAAKDQSNSSKIAIARRITNEHLWPMIRTTLDAKDVSNVGDSSRRNSNERLSRNSTTENAKSRPQCTLPPISQKYQNNQNR
ncbi:hypothetical protein Ddc_02087 [Ditylenchus destructor]|nr:hypothetical protein Ddc_02087 [Ditylenchus destructor]